MLRSHKLCQLSTKTTKAPAKVLLCVELPGLECQAVALRLRVITDEVAQSRFRGARITEEVTLPLHDSTTF